MSDRGDEDDDPSEPDPETDRSSQDSEGKRQAPESDRERPDDRRRARRRRDRSGPRPSQRRTPLEGSDEELRRVGPEADRSQADESGTKRPEESDRERQGDEPPSQEPTSLRQEAEVIERGTGGGPDAPTGPGEVGLDPEDILEYTTDRRSLTPAVQLQWGLWTTLGVVILTAIITAILGNFGIDPRVGALVLVALFVLGMVWVALRYKRWVYQVQEDALYLERGVVTHVRTLAPYVRIQHVDTSRGPLERALGLSTLVVYTAGSRGADVSIPGLTPEEARDLQQRVKELAIEAEGGDAL